jgi:hypothetical protein
MPGLLYQAPLANLETPGLEINLMFRKVRHQVFARTNNAQEPFTYASLPGGEIVFQAGGGALSSLIDVDAMVSHWSAHIAK